MRAGAPGTGAAGTGTVTTGAVLLAGGSGRRLGGVDKGAIRFEGETLLRRAVAALADLELVVVGPVQELEGVRFVREEPPGSGPASAVLAGLQAIGNVDEVLLLAVDLPRLPDAVGVLRTAGLGPDGAVAIDATGRAQWLLGRYRVPTLRRAAARFGDPTGRPLRALLAGLRLQRIRMPDEFQRDVDTVDDARRAGVVLPGEETR